MGLILFQFLFHLESLFNFLSQFHPALKAILLIFQAKKLVTLTKIKIKINEFLKSIQSKEFEEWYKLILTGLSLNSCNSSSNRRTVFILNLSLNLAI